jgi:Family of unknown function (DUF6191)
MGELGAMFNPGMRHELEERRSKAMRREEEGNARDGDLRIDLESGVAVINAPGSTDSGKPQPEATSAPGERAGSETPADGTADPEPAASTEQSATAARSDQLPALRPRGKRGMAASAR